MVKEIMMKKKYLTKHEIVVILEQYDVEPETQNIIADKILALASGVVQQSELVCYIHNGIKCENSFPSYIDGKCHYCGGQAN